MFIIDEADMTLEYGFLEDIDVVFASMKSNPEIMCFEFAGNREIVLFKFAGKQKRVCIL